MDELIKLSDRIFETHQFFKQYALRQINNAFTLRNWMIGYYIVTSEQEGKQRAPYGYSTLKELSDRLTHILGKGFSERNLRLFRQFYLEYPEIWQLITAKFQNIDIQRHEKWQSLTAKSDANTDNNLIAVPISVLIDKLSFTHIIELLKIENDVKRTFYEIQAIKNNWTVDVLKRNIESLLYERIGLSVNKKEMLLKLTNEKHLHATDLIKNPYLLDFLGVEEKAEFSETDLEQAIVTHLQKFLIEMGRGFCFEARQKRISFNNRHYRIDLVFYHRILKCHVLIDLKMGEFDHADAGQMNVYLNYYKENEMCDGDNPPVGIILCSQKDDALVHYATGGLPQEVFVSRYLLQLPSVDELRKLINDEIRQNEI